MGLFGVPASHWYLQSDVEGRVSPPGEPDAPADLLRRQRRHLQRLKRLRPVRREDVEGSLGLQLGEGGPQQVQEVLLPESWRTPHLLDRVLLKN